jgi:hypothetical protein
MKNEERTHRNAHFQKELDSLRINKAHVISLLEHTLKNIFGKGLSNWSVAFI